MRPQRLMHRVNGDAIPQSAVPVRHAKSSREIVANQGYYIYYTLGRQTQSAKKSDKKQDKKLAPPFGKLQLENQFSKN